MNISYTFNTHYEYHPDITNNSIGAHHFYNDFVLGTNLIVFVVNNQSSFSSLKLMCKSLQEHARKALLVYNISNISKVPVEEVKKL